MNSLNEYAERDSKNVKIDFMKMIYVEQKIIKIQAHFRRVLALKRIEKDIEKQKQDLMQKKQRKAKVSREELALIELKQRLSKRGLTPEAFFRTCDD